MLLVSEGSGAARKLGESGRKLPHPISSESDHRKPRIEENNVLYRFLIDLKGKLTWKIEGKLPEKHVKTARKTSLKLPPTTRKLFINNPGLRKRYQTEEKLPHLCTGLDTEELHKEEFPRKFL